jgi:hypothetical protein
MRWQFAEMVVAQGTISPRLANHTQLLGARIRLTSDATSAECLESSQELLCGCTLLFTPAAMLLPSMMDKLFVIIMRK